MCRTACLVFVKLLVCVLLLLQREGTGGHATERCVVVCRIELFRAL